MREPALLNQRSRADLANCLEKKTRMHPNCEVQFNEIFEDLDCTVALPPLTDKNPLVHMERIIEGCIRDSRTRYKIGMTVEPVARFQTKWCAYTSNQVKKRDGVNWNRMVIMYAHRVQAAVSHLEHALIHINKRHAQCMNARSEIDDYSRFKEGSSDSEKENHYHIIISSSYVNI